MVWITRFRLACYLKIGSIVTPCKHFKIYFVKHICKKKIIVIFLKLYSHKKSVTKPLSQKNQLESANTFTYADRKIDS